MTREEIDIMWQQALRDSVRDGEMFTRYHFAKMIAEQEREACAKVCEFGADAMHPTVEGHVMKNFGASTHLAQAIRARGKA